MSVEVVFGVIVTFFGVVDSFNSNCLVVIVIAAIERVLGLGAAGCHLVGQALKLVALTACVLRRASGFAKLDDDLGSGFLGRIVQCG